MWCGEDRTILLRLLDNTRVVQETKPHEFVVQSRVVEPRSGTEFCQGAAGLFFLTLARATVAR